ncbi:MAG: Gfo/Idh/MocA family protein [Candidatus Flemingiibacterium sp.]
MNDIRVGLIGCGGISGAHLPQLRDAEGCKIRALCDINKDRLNAAGDKYGVPAERRFTDYRDLISHPEVDAVDICTPNCLHVPMAEAAVEAGKPFCCEKPLGVSYDETLKLKELADAKGIKSMVCFSYRFKPAVRYAKYLVDRGDIGNVISIYAQYFKSSAFMKDRPLDWRFVGHDARYGVSGDLGVHILDLASFLAGDVTAVTADLGIAVKERKRIGSDEIAPVETDDFCHFLAKFSGGASATFSITRAAFGNSNQIRVEIYGDKGGFRFDLNHDDRLEYYTGGIKEGNAIEKMETVEVPSEFRAVQMQCFIDLLHGKPDRYIPTLEDGVKLQRVLDAILESDEKRQWINI